MPPAPSPKGLLHKFLGYGMTGGIAAVFDLLGFVALHQIGFAVALAAALSFLFAALINYLLSARFVFAAPANASNFALFLAVAVVGFAINVSVTTLAQIQGGLSPWLAKLTGIGCAFFINFAMNAGFVFRKR